MADEQTYVIRLFGWVGRAIGSSSDLFTDFKTDDLGVELPPAVTSAGPVVTALQQSATAATNVSGASTDLLSVAESTEEMQILAAFFRFGAALIAYYEALDGLSTSVHGAGATLPDPGEATAAQNFAAELAERVSSYALAALITDELPELGVVLRLFGLLDWRYLPAAPGQPLSSEHVRRVLELRRFRDLVQDPGGHFQRALGWGDPSFDPSTIFSLIADFFDEEASVEVGATAGDPFLRIGNFTIRRDSSVTPPALLMQFLASVSASRNDRFQVTDGWEFGIDSSLRLSGSIGGKIKPPFVIELLPATGDVSGELKLLFDRNADARPFDILGGTGLVDISATNLTAGVGAIADFDIPSATATIDPLIFADIEGLTLKIGSSEGDGFIGKLLAGADIKGEFDLGLEWQMTTGLRVKASGGVEVALPIHKQLGPIGLDTIYISLKIRDDGTLALELSTAVSATLGPLSAAVDRIGAELDVKFGGGADSRFGAADVDLHFKPPNGVGLGIDAAIVTGGGYLFIDTDRGEYDGVLQLSIADIVTVTAIGLITTKNPDGSSGFSLLVIITAEFGAGIQLGFGFVLLGVGGLLGLNRTAKLEPLTDGVRTGAIDGIMFPHDVVANASRIISDLRNWFPPQPDSFLVGPMAKFGWGSPALVTVSFGIIIEIPPGNIVILGVLRVLLPTEDEALVRLQVAFIGAIEFDKKRLWFFASLFDSRILFITIEGDFGLLIAWGDDANFVLTVGGFHPAFQPPPLPFPNPRRLAVSLIDTDYARVRIEGYFAVTSNTVQFGAAVEIYFGFDAFNISGHLALDALFQFSPFHFIVSISASFSLNVFGFSLLGISISGSLSGPAPWEAKGTGSITILFFSISADFDVTWGDSDNTTLPPVAVMPLFQTEIEKAINWRALPPESSNLLVSLRKLPDSDGLVLHPVGTLRVSQRAVPLDLTLDKVGNQSPSDVNRLRIDVTGGGLVKKGDALEQFAPAQFQNFSDSDKLSRPAYVSEHGGVDLGGSAGDLGTQKLVKRVVRYEEVILDTNVGRATNPFFEFASGLFAHFLRGGSVTKSDLSKTRKSKLDPFPDKVKVGPDTYTVAFQSDNRAFSAESASFSSEASAREFLSRRIDEDPNLADALHVIPSFERAA